MKRFLPYFLLVASAYAQPQPILFDLTGADVPTAGQLPVYSSVIENFVYEGIGDVPTPWTTGSILFVDSMGQITQDNGNFFWDDANNRLGVGTVSPSNELHIKSSAPFLRVELTGFTSEYIGYLSDYAGIWLAVASPDFSNYNFLSRGDGQVFFNTANTGIADIELRIGNSTSFTVGNSGIAYGIGANTAPSLPLEIRASIGGSLVFSTDTSGNTYNRGNITLEGTTADASETALTVADPTTDRTVTLADANGTVFLSTLATNAPEAASSIWGSVSGLNFEGTTANANEILLTYLEPTADRTIVLPDTSGDLLVVSPAGTILNFASIGVTNLLTANNVVSNQIRLTELGGGTDPFAVQAFASITTSRTGNLPDMDGTFVLSTLSTNSLDIANSVWLASSALVFEGSTANTFETSIIPTNPTADRTITLPDASGTVALTTSVPLIQHERITTGSIGAGSTALITVTYNSAFADTNYTVSASVEDATTSSLSLSVVHVESVSTTQTSVRVINNALGSLTGTLHVIAIHD